MKNSNGIIISHRLREIQLPQTIDNYTVWMNSPKAIQPIRLTRQSHIAGQNKNIIQINEPKVKQPPILRSNKNKTINELKLNNLLTYEKTETNRQANPLPSIKNKQIIRNQKSLKSLLTIQNIQPNIPTFNQMHAKLDSLEDKLSKMKEKFTKKKEQRKNRSLRQIEFNKSQMLKQKQNSEDLLQVVSQVNYPKKLKATNCNPYNFINNTYYVSQLAKSYKQLNSLARQHLISSFLQLKNLNLQHVRGHNKQQLILKKLNLIKRKEHEGKKTIIFDLDETLIHCNEKASMACDVKLKVTFPNGHIVQAGINIRPYATEMIRRLSQKFEIMVFTASHSCYANVVLNHLDPQNKFIAHRLFRQHCFQTTEGVYIKDLRIINRQLTDIVLVDNAAYSYCLQIENGIPILPFYQGKVDYQLKALEHYLQTLIHCKDVRDCNRNTFKLNKYIEFKDPDTLFEKLYEENFQLN